jgi:F420-dependent oxidoreductase-like protein
VRVGLQVPNFTWPGGASQLGATFGAIAERTERAGFYSLWVMDHFFQIPFVGPVDTDMLEGWSALAFAAGRTSRIRLGTMVTGVTYRQPGVLVKTATTLDVLSGGRAYFGVGAAWNEDEHRGLGVPFPPLAERFERLEETLRIAMQMWSDDGRQDDAQPFDGAHYHLERTLNVPQALQRPHPPIMIGGGGERKTLRLVAQYGDACNLFYRLGREELTRKLDVLQEHCEQLNRPYGDIEKTSLNHVRIPAQSTLDANETIDAFAEQAELGFDQGIVSLSNVSDPHAFEIWEERIVPEVTKLSVAGR